MKSRPAILAALGVAIAITALLAAGRFNSLLPERTVFAQGSEPSLEVEPCLQVGEGETFELDIVARDVTNLLAFEVYFAYDRDIVRVVGVDVRQLLAADPNSAVNDKITDPVPNATGLYRMAAADLSFSGTGESGDGVLGRLTIEAMSKGVSPANIFRIDLDRDGAADFGPTITSRGGVHLADPNGNAIFDGAAFSGQIAVGGPCRPVAPTPDPEDYVGSLPNVTPAPTPGEGGPPPAEGGITPEPKTPTPSPTPRRPDDRTPRPVVTPFVNRGSGSGGLGGGITTWLISIAGGSAGLGLAITFFVLKTARRPA